MKEWIIIGLGQLLAWTLIIGGILGVVFSAYRFTIKLEELSCHEKAKMMGFNSDWTFMTRCMVEYQPGKFIPLSNYRVDP